jgi:hypothetical protein
MPTRTETNAAQRLPSGTLTATASGMYYYYYYYYYLYTAIWFAPGGSSPNLIKTKGIKQPIQ